MAGRWNRVGVLFAVFLAAAACLPVTSKSPLGTTAGYKADPQLAGMWKSASDQSAPWFAFFPQPDGSTKAVMIEPASQSDKGGWMVFDLRTTTLGSDRYMDASVIEDDGKPPAQALDHIPVLYSFGADGSLTLTVMDEDAVKDAISAGKIAGQAEPGQTGDVVLTATPAALDAFLESPGGRALFKKPLVTLSRVKS